MFKKRGFTLIELIIVVIIIGVLAAVAVPQYMRAVERAKGAKAMNALGLIGQAEKMYRAEYDVYVDAPSPGNETKLTDRVEMKSIMTDTDWSYDANVDLATEGTIFTITATRQAGPYINGTLIFNQDGYAKSTSNFTVKP